MKLGHPREGGPDEDNAGVHRPVHGELPREYAVELNRLIEMQLEGAVG